MKVVLWKKVASKNIQYLKNKTILKIGKPLQNGRFGSKIKILKNMQKSFLQSHESSSMKKNCFKKDQIFKKWDNCENLQKGLGQKTKN